MQQLIKTKRDPSGELRFPRRMAAASVAHCNANERLEGLINEYDAVIMTEEANTAPTRRDRLAEV